VKVGEAIARAISTESSGPIFCLMGDGNIHVLPYSIEVTATKLIHCRHEAAAVAMADGFARLTGDVGVASVTCGPGFTQVATSLVAARRNRTPLVLLVGDTPARPNDPAQVIDQSQFASACEALFQPIERVDTIAEDVRDAFYMARTQRRPVVLNVPIDLQLKDLPFEWDYRPSRDFVPAEQRPVPESSAIDLVVSALKTSNRPLFLAGRGAIGSGAQKELVAVADAVGALLGTTLPAKGSFDGHPWNIGIVGAFCSAPAERVIALTDLVVGVGAELGHHTTEGGFLFPEAKVIRIDIEAAPNRIHALSGIYLQGDARETMRAIRERLNSDPRPRIGFRTEDVRAVLDTVPPPHDPVAANTGINPRELMAALGPLLPQNCRVICGVGHFWSFAGQYLALRPDVDISFVHQFSSIGQTLPTAIGGAFADPSRPVVMIEGDGSLMMHIQELDTAARYAVDLTVLVMNDGALGAEVHKLRAAGHDGQLAVYPSPDFAKITEGMGGSGVRLDSVAQLEATMRSLPAQRRPFLIDARISPLVISDPYQRIHFGRESRAPLQPVLGARI